MGVFTGLGIVTSIGVVIIGVGCSIFLIKELLSDLKETVIDSKDTRKELIRLRELIDRKLAKLED